MALQNVKKSAPMKVRKVQKAPAAQEAKKQMITGEAAVSTVGRRKTATARVRLFHGGNSIVVNTKPAQEYFKAVDPTGNVIVKAFQVTNTVGTMSCSAKTKGSGMKAQLDAVIFGIARGLAKLNGEHKLALRKAGLLTRDDRMKESRKIGQGGRARKAKQSPKR